MTQGETPSSKQVTKDFLFHRAFDFFNTRPEIRSLPRSLRRERAREMAKRIQSQAKEEKLNANI